MIVSQFTGILKRKPGGALYRFANFLHSVPHDPQMQACAGWYEQWPPRRTQPKSSTTPPPRSPHRRPRIGIPEYRGGLVARPDLLHATHAFHRTPHCCARRLCCRNRRWCWPRTSSRVRPCLISSAAATCAAGRVRATRRVGGSARQAQAGAGSTLGSTPGGSCAHGSPWKGQGSTCWTRSC